MMTDYTDRCKNHHMYIFKQAIKKQILLKEIKQQVPDIESQRLTQSN